MDWEQLWNTIVTWASQTGIKIIIALVILLISFRIVTLIARRWEKKLKNSKKNVDKTISKVLIYVFKIGAKILIALALVGYLGIDTSGVTALIASLGVGVGLAVNGALSNLAGGVLLLVTRPFKIDDYIEACGESGTVEDIRITQTRLRTPDNKVIYIPNGTLSSSTIVNYSEKDIRRLDFTFSISYSNDFEKAKAIILDIVNAHELVLREPAEPFVRVSAHAQSSIDIATRVWVKSGDYWTVHFDVLESVKKAFDNEGIEIPYNQLDVHVKKD